MMRVGYVLKRYPRYSETFIIHEILAHEAAGLGIEIFSLRPPNDTHFQDILGKVRAPVTLIPSEGLKAADLWQAMDQAAMMFGDLSALLVAARGANAVDVYQAITVAREVRLRGIGHLHAHFGSVATSVARLAARLAGLTYTFTAHAKDIFHDTVSAEDARRKLADAAAVVTVCDYNLEYLRQTYGANAFHITRIYNGLDLAQFPFQPPVARPPLIVGVGRLIQKKGFADLIEACALLKRRGVAFTCTIIGTGEQEAALCEQIARLGVGDRMTLAGPRPYGEVKRFVGGAALLAAPCVVGSDGNQDGLPMVLLEAMALGTPCISTDVAGIPEVVRDGATGLIVPQHSPAALAEAMARLLADPQLRVGLAAQARALVEDEFDIYRNAARLREIFMRTSRLAPASVAEGAR